MKRPLAFILLLCLASCCACVGQGVSPSGFDPFGRSTHAPFFTPEATAAPETEAPATEAPATEAPATEAPATEAPAELTPNPFLPRIGRLCDGPIFPEPAKYLVISGESDNFYVYDNMGELIETFHAVEDDFAWGYAGFFGPEGICENVRIATGERVEPFDIFDDMVLRTSWYSDDNSWGYKLTGLYNEDFGEVFSAESLGRELELGEAGGVLHVDGKYLVIGRRMDWDADDDSDGLHYVAEPLLIDAEGRLTGTVDPAPFGRMFGVLGGKYLICSHSERFEPWELLDGYLCEIFTLDGQLVRQGVKPIAYSTYSADEELSAGMLIAANYVEDEQGNFYDADLEPVSELPADAAVNPVRERYGNLQFDDRDYYGWGNVYVGVKDSEGNWLFRIYNPKLASDAPGEDEYWMFDD
ncbi:MAG: hypothetical protein IKP26_01465 [Clostridia bacterium]|nr:hypothetical protein [Clostridia bacterium]MBR6109636.1 hypothetical protein [Clostridia bacterium]